MVVYIHFNSNYDINILVIVFQFILYYTEYCKTYIQYIMTSDITVDAITIPPFNSIKLDRF
jgi:hypothetical protein